MNPAREKYYRFLFSISAIYDFLLGVTFMFFAERAFAALGISDKLPAIRGYLTLLGAFVERDSVSYPRYPAVFPNWDNTPRQPLRGTSFDGASPHASM